MKRVIIVSSNFPGAGKTTISRALSHKLGLFHYSSGDMVRYIFGEMGEAQHGPKFAKEQKDSEDFDPKKTLECIKKWFDGHGFSVRLDNLLEKGDTFDHVIEKVTLRVAERGDCIIDSWLAKYIINSSRDFKGAPKIKLGDEYHVLKIELVVPIDVAAKRVAAREDYKSVENAKRDLISRFETVKERLKRLYNIDISEDTVKVDLIVHTDQYTITEMVSKVMSFVRSRLHF